MQKPMLLTNSRRPNTPPLLFLTGLLLLAGTLAGQAQTTQIKAANATALTTGSSWVSGTIPTSGGIGEWNSVATATGDTITSLGGAFSLGEIQVANNVAGAVSITDNTPTDILTLNGATGTGVGIDLSVANQNLTIGAPVNIGANQTWKIASGKGLFLTGTNLLTLNANTVTILGGGTNFYEPTTPVKVAGASTTGAGLIISNSTFFVYIQKNSSSGLANYLGASTALTLDGNSYFSEQEVGSSGYHTQTFTSLTLNPGADLFENTIGRGSSSGISAGFTVINRNGGSLADFVANTGTWGSSANVYGLPGTTVLGYATWGANDWANAKGANTTLAAPTYVNDSWTTAANNVTVTVSSAPPSGSTINSLRFGAAVSPTLTLSGANVITTGGILLNSTVGTNNVTLTGGTLTSGNANADGTHDLIIFNNTASKGNLIINTVLADNTPNSVGLTVGSTAATTPTGVVQLNAANTFSGTTYVAKGKLVLNNSLALQDSTFNTSLAGTLSLGTLSAATFAGLSGSGNLALPANFSLTVGNNNASSIFNGAISGPGASLLKTGTGTFTVNGANTYTGTTTIGAGTLALGAAGSFHGAASVSAGSTLDVSVAGNYPLAAVVSGAGSINGSVTLNTGGQLAPTGTAGSLTLSNSLTLNGGTIAISITPSQHGLVTIGASGSGNLNLTAGTVILNITGGTLPNGTYKIIGVPSGTINGSGSLLAVAGFSQAGQAAALVANPGELDLVVSSHASQNLTWVGDGSANLWNVDGSADWYDNTTTSSAQFNNYDQTTFNDTSANQTVNLSGVLSPASVTISGTKSYTFTGTGSVDGSASLTDNNIGTLTVLTLNNYYGGTTIGGSATVQVGNGTTAGSIGNGPVVNNATLVFDEPASTNVLGAASGSGSLTTTGTGTVVLTGADTLAGGTTITTGTLQQGAANVLPNGAGVGNTVVNGTLDLAGQNGTVNGLSGTGTIDTTQVGIPVFTVTGGGLFGGVIQNTAGSLTLNVNGPGQTLELTNVNTFGGGATVTSGTLQLGNNGAVSGGPVSVAANGILDLNGYSPTIDTLTGSGIVDDVNGGGTSTLTVGNLGGSGTFSGTIQNSSGTIDLVKNGAGTETFTGGNTYTGSTTGNAGTIEISTGGTISTSTIGGLGFLVDGGTLNVSGSPTLADSASAFLETAGTVTISGTLYTTESADGTLYEVTGGSFTAQAVTLARTWGNSTGTVAIGAPLAASTTSGFVENGPTAVVDLTTFTIGAANANSDASAYLGSGSLTVSGELLLGNVSGGRWNAFQINGGFLTDSDTVNGLVIAPNNGANTVNSEFYLSGPSTNQIGIINFGLATDTVGGAGWLFVNGGASLYLGSGGIVQGNTKGYVSTVVLTSGTLAATADWSSTLPLHLNGTNFVIQPADTTGNPWNISLSGVLSIGTNSSALTISGIPGGAGGTVFLTGANQYNAGTLVTNNATLAINGIYALGGGNYDGLTLNGGTLQYTNLGYPGNGTYDLTTGTNSIKLGVLGGSIDVNGNNVAYTNSLSGPGSLTVLSTITNGVLTLSTNSTYTGATIIGNNNASISGNGTLNVINTSGSGTGSGNVTVQFGGTLTGGGGISGAVEIQRGGFLAPGNGVGTNAVGGLTLDSGGFGNFEIGVNGNDETLVTTAGGFVINDGSDNFAFNLYAAGSTAPWTTPGTYKLIQFSGTAPSLDSSWTTVSGSNPHVANPQPSSVYSFGISGGFLTVTIAGNGTSVAGTWTNPAGGNWATAANWSSNPYVPHSAGDSATFGTASGLNTVTLNANETIGVITFNNGNSFDIANGGHTLTLDNAILPADIYAVAGTANLIQIPVALNDDTSVSVSGGVTLTVTGAIANATTASQPETLTVSGSGTLVLAGNNTYGPTAASGFGTTLNAGTTVKVASNTALAAGDVSVAGNSTLQAGAANLSLPNNIDVPSGVTLTVDNNGQNLSLNGNITDSGNLTKIGLGVLSLNGANNNYSGVTTIDAGILSLANNGNLESSSSVNLNGGDLLGAATFSLSPNIGIGLTGGSTSTNGLLDAAAGQVFTIGGSIASAGNTGTNNLVVNSEPGSTGTVVLQGANTFNGQTVVANGVLDLQSATALQLSTLNYNNQGGQVVFDGIATATLGGLTGSQNLSLTNLGSGGLALSVGNNGGTNVYTGNLNDDTLGGSLTKVGGGWQTLAGTNTFTGNVSVSLGTLELPAPGAIDCDLFEGTGGTLLVDGGTLSNNVAGTSPAFAGENVFTETAGSATVGTWRSSNNDGTLFAFFGGYFSAVNITLQRTLANETAPTATAPIAAATTSGVYVDSTNTASPAVVNLGSLTIGTANSSCSVRVDGGTVTVTNELLIGDQDATGNRWDILQVNGGTLTSLDTNNGLVLAVNNAGNNNNAELYLSGGTTYAELIAFGSTTDTNVGEGDIIISGGSLYLGSLGITNANTSGYTYLIALNSGLLGALGNLSITNSLLLSTTNFTFQAADNNGVAQNISLGGVITGTGGLIKSGAGVLSLNNNADTWTGSTFITNGTLALAGLTGISNSPSVALAAPGILNVTGRSDDTFPLGTVTAQTLEGNGTIAGNLAVGSLGTVAPGAYAGSPATLTVSGSVKLAGAALFNINHAGSPNSDEIVSPAITAGGTLTVTNTGAALHAGDTFHLFSTGVSGSFAAVNLPTTDAVNKYTYTWSNQLTANGTVVVQTAAPTVNANPTNITATVSGNVLTLTWPADHTGWTLQSQTNNLSTGLSGNWVSIPGSTTVNGATNTINPSVGTVFYRLVYTNTP